LSEAETVVRIVRHTIAPCREAQKAFRRVVIGAPGQEPLATVLPRGR
jgi:hypothetical protein